MLTVRYSWRNLWRNWKRTAITLAALTCNIVILVVIYCLMDGMIVQAVGYVTDMSVGEVQVHDPQYREERSFYESIDNPGRVMNFAEEHDTAAAPRSYGYGLVAQETKSAGALFYGVDPEREKEVFDLYKHIFKGSYLGDEAAGGVVLGKKLAYSLDADVGDEIVALVQAADGSMGSALFTVTGVLKSVGDDIDRTGAFVHSGDFGELFVSGGRIHEIAFNTRGRVPPGETAGMIASEFPDLETMTWRELKPEFSAMIHVFDQAIVLFLLIFCFAAGLGVLNTLLMATYERMREFGIIKAMGASPLRIVLGMAVEALLLAAVSTVAGLALALPSSWLLKVYGINTARFGAADISFSGIAFDPVWRAHISAEAVFVSIVIVWISCLLASLYPAIVAARLDPVRTMRHH